MPVSNKEKKRTKKKMSSGSYTDSNGGVVITSSFNFLDESVEAPTDYKKTQLDVSIPKVGEGGGRSEGGAW